MNEYISSSNSQSVQLYLFAKENKGDSFLICLVYVQPEICSHKLIVTNSNQSNNWLNFITDGFFPCKIGAISLPFFWKVDFSSSHLQRAS